MPTSRATRVTSRGEGAELVDHGVEGVLELEDLALHIDGDLAGEIAASDGGRDFRNVADLRGEVAGHEVDVVGEVLPSAGDAGDFCLTGQLALGSDFAGDASDFGGKRVELVDHGVDGVF